MSQGKSIGVSSMRILGLLALSAGLLASPALAQSTTGTWSDLDDHFQIDTGYFRLSADTVLRFDGPSDIDFERDLGVDQHVDTFWVDATWRVGRRHQLKLGFTRLNREHDGQTLQRDFTWGGETYNAGLTANTTTGSDILGGYYRFAVYRNERFEIGPSIGIGYLWLNAGIEATGTIAGPGGAPISRSLERNATTGQVTGAVGGYAAAWPTKRLALRADYLYIKVNPENAEASVTDWRVGGDYYFLRNVGLGVQYKYNQYRYDRGPLETELGGELTFQGFQAFLSFLF
jgi:predicted porin